MSGGLLTPVTSDPLPDPRTCYLCREEFRDPRLLQCCHSFCARCLQDRVMDMALLCPICGTLTKLEGQQQLPPADPFITYLVEASHEDKPVCANCDQWADAMFFCNTCSQPLCGECRQATHRAKMFSSHHIGPMTLRAREIYKSCYLHGEPYILFSIERRNMLCINCFQDLNVESRPFCIDLDSAYSQSCQVLDQSLQTVKEVQRSVQDGILLLWSLLQEVKQNAEQERVAILTMYSDITEKIAAKRDDLLEDVERQSQSKDRQFSEHLRKLNSLLPTVQTQLQMTSEFSSTANKYEFLELAYKLMERINHTIHSNPHLQPSVDGSIQTNYRAQFARSLDSLLSLKPVNRFGEHSPTLSPASLQSHPDYKRNDTVESTLPSPTATSTITFTTDGGRKINGSSGVNKVIMIESNGVFADHFKELENKHREIVQRFEAVKGCVQELQRDMTLRRCLAKTTKVTELINNTAKIDDDIVTHLESAEKQRPMLEKHWENIYRQVSDEQEVYQAQVNDILRMRQEAQHLNTIVKKLAPFVKSITNVTERLSPRLGNMARENDKGDQMQEMFEHINTLEPDSQHRVDAIRNTEEERQLQSANRVNPLDGELIRTKGMLKSPSVRIEREELARQAKESQQEREDTVRPSKESQQETEEQFIQSNESKQETEEKFIQSNEGKQETEEQFTQSKEGKQETEEQFIQSNEGKQETEEQFAQSKESKQETEEHESEDCAEQATQCKQDREEQICNDQEYEDQTRQATEAKQGDTEIESEKETENEDLGKEDTEQLRNEVTQESCKDNVDATANVSDSQDNANSETLSSDAVSEERPLLCGSLGGDVDDISNENNVKGHSNDSLTEEMSTDEIIASFDEDISAKASPGRETPTVTSALTKGIPMVMPEQPIRNQRHRNRGKTKELRKCNSLGRGSKSKSESRREGVTRKFSFDLGGISADDLALRSLLHDAILARAENAKKEKE